MEVDATLGGAAGGGWDSAVDSAFDWFEQIPERRGGVMAQHRVLATSENRGHPAPVPVRCAMSHRVDAAVDAVKAPGADSSRDRFRTQARCFDLLSRHHPVLTGGNCSHPPIGRVEFCVHTDL